MEDTSLARSKLEDILEHKESLVEEIRKSILGREPYSQLHISLSAVNMGLEELKGTELFDDYVKGYELMSKIFSYLVGVHSDLLFYQTGDVVNLKVKLMGSDNEKDREVVREVDKGLDTVKEYFIEEVKPKIEEWCSYLFDENRIPYLEALIEKREDLADPFIRSVIYTDRILASLASDATYTYILAEDKVRKLFERFKEGVKKFNERLDALLSKFEPKESSDDTMYR